MLNQLGQELVALPSAIFKEVPVSDSTREAVIEAKRLSRGALQRQYRRIAKLMQGENLDAIRIEIERHKQPNRQQVNEMHTLEDWRARLLVNDEGLLTELIKRFPTIDRQYMRQLVRNSQLETKRNKSPKSSRLLYQYLAELLRLEDEPNRNSEHSQ